MSSAPSDHLAPPKSPAVRRRSLQLPQNLSIPIPPSLRHSPYLISNESVFQRSAPLLHTPTEEDEQWLQDTVPLSLDHHLPSGGDRSQARLSISSVSSGGLSDSSVPDSIQLHHHQKTSASRGRPQSTQLLPTGVPHSPPIDYWKHHHSHIVAVPPPWRQHPVRVHSAPCIRVEVSQL